MSSIIILADDLTGANDAAIHFAKNGFSTIVKVSSNEVRDIIPGNNYEVISINTDTRSVSGEEAYARIYEISREIKNSYNNLLYKKIDSILRGNPAAELEAVMDATNNNLAIVAPSFPDNNRALSQGILSAPNLKIDVVKTFSLNMQKKVQKIPLHIVRGGENQIYSFIKQEDLNSGIVFILDACTNDDLKIIKNAINLIKEPKIICGSAGLATQLSETDARYLNNRTLLKNNKDNNLIIVAIGSYKLETARQLKNLSVYYNLPIITLETNLIVRGDEEKVINHCLDALIKQIKQGNKILLLSIDTLHDNMKINLENLRIVNTIGKIVQRIYDAYDIYAIVSAGGDTSLGICKTLSTAYIRPIDEIQPGIPVGIMIDGLNDSIVMVTKSGGFGDENALIEVMKYLNNAE